MSFRCYDMMIVVVAELLLPRDCGIDDNMKSS